MKASCSIFTLFFLLLLGLNRMEARRSPEEYWRHVMGDDPMPEAIADLVVNINQDQGKVPVHRGYSGASSQMNWDRWIKRDFDTRTTAIIYHQHDHSRMVPPHDHHHHGDGAS